MSGGEVLAEKLPGNSIPATRPKKAAWMFTINNYTELDIQQVRELKGVQYIVYSFEVGEKGTPHIQGYVYFKSERHGTALSKLLPRASLRWADGSAEENRGYIIGPYEHNGKSKPYNPDHVEEGQMPEQGKRNDLVKFHQAIKRGLRGRDLSKDHIVCRAKYPRLENTLIFEEDEDTAWKAWEQHKAPEVHVRYGPPDSGKTRFVYDLHGREVFAPLIEHREKVWFDGYRGQSVILLDEFEGQIGYRQFLRIIDRYPIAMQVKGGHVWRLASRIYITSNRHPKDWYPGEDFGPLERRLTSVTICEPLTP